MGRRTVAWRRRVLVPESRSRRRKICGGLRGDLWRCGHDTGRNGIRLEGGIQKDARDHHEPDRIIRGRTKRNDGRKLFWHERTSFGWPLKVEFSTNSIIYKLTKVNLNLRFSAFCKIFFWSIGQKDVKGKIKSLCRIKRFPRSLKLRGNLCLS